MPGDGARVSAGVLVSVFNGVDVAVGVAVLAGAGTGGAVSVGVRVTVSIGSGISAGTGVSVGGLVPVASALLVSDWMSAVCVAVEVSCRSCVGVSVAVGDGEEQAARKIRSRPTATTSVALDSDAVFTWVSLIVERERGEIPQDFVSAARDLGCQDMSILNAVCPINTFHLQLSTAWAAKLDPDGIGCTTKRFLPIVCFCF